jgi:hypothetical protein
MLLYKFFNTLRETPDNAKHVQLTMLCVFIACYSIAGAIIFSKLELEADVAYREHLRGAKMAFLRAFPCISGSYHTLIRSGGANEGWGTFTGAAIPI